MSENEEIIDIKASDGTTVLRFKLFQDRLMPLRATNIEERFKMLKTLEFVNGDVLIVSYPKTGTRWLVDSIAMLMKGKAEVQVQTVEGYLDMMSDLRALVKKDPPRLMETHLLPDDLSEDFLSNGKFILLLRNPKDTIVSLYHHIKKDSVQFFSESWDNLVECFVSVKVHGRPVFRFFDFYRAWQAFMTSHRGQVLVVYYEDMHKDYPKQLRRISDFLGYDLTDETIAAIAEKGNVHTIKEELMQCKAMKDYAAKLSTDGTLPFYRKGIVGDWKNHFTVAQSEMFDKAIEEEMKTLDFKFEF